jgi:hypothetical protein
LGDGYVIGTRSVLSVPRWKRRRVEGDVGGGDLGGTRVATVEQDQRERSLSPSLAIQSVSALASSSSSRSLITGAVVVLVDIAGEGGNTA